MSKDHYITAKLISNWCTKPDRSLAAREQLVYWYIKDTDKVQHLPAASNMSRKDLYGVGSSSIEQSIITPEETKQIKLIDSIINTNDGLDSVKLAGLFSHYTTRSGPEQANFKKWFVSEFEQNMGKIDVYETVKSVMIIDWAFRQQYQRKFPEIEPDRLTMIFKNYIKSRSEYVTDKTTYADRYVEYLTENRTYDHDYMKILSKLKYNRVQTISDNGFILGDCGPVYLNKTRHGKKFETVPSRDTIASIFPISPKVVVVGEKYRDVKLKGSNKSIRFSDLGEAGVNIIVSRLSTKLFVASNDSPYYTTLRDMYIGSNDRFSHYSLNDAVDSVTAQDTISHPAKNLYWVGIEEKFGYELERNPFLRKILVSVTEARLFSDEKSIDNFYKTLEKYLPSQPTI